MKQIYHHYMLWEDWKNGLYNKIDEKFNNLFIDKAKEVLSNNIFFYNIMKELILNWKFSVEQHLSNLSENRRAWLGQASCCYKFGVPEYLTRIAWNQLTLKQQTIANKTADIIITKFENKNILRQKCLNDY